MIMFLLNTLCHKFLGTNQPEGWVRSDRKLGTERPSLDTNRLDTKRPWVRKDWCSFLWH